jgi:hypothetical protein
MTEVADHLVPIGGLTNAKIEFVGLFLRDHVNMVRFNLTDADGGQIGLMDLAVEPAGNADLTIAAGHRQMVDILRQWLHDTDFMRNHYEKQGARS